MNKKTLRIIVIILIVIALGVGCILFIAYRNNKNYYANSQVKERMDVLGYSGEDFEQFNNANNGWQDIYNLVTNDNDNESNNISYCDLKNASEINAYLSDESKKNIKFTSDVINIDEAIKPSSNQVLDFENVRFNNISTQQFLVGVLIENKSNVVIKNLVLNEALDYGIYIIDSKDIDILGSVLDNAKIKGLAIMGNNDNFYISNVTIENNGDGGAYFDGDVKNGVIENSSFSNNRGASNFSAGLVLSAVEIQDKKTVYNIAKDVLLKDKVKTPNHLVFINNIISNNNSSGLYSEGGYCNYYINNNISGNDKEGMCLDFGSFGNWLSGNVFFGNGWRGRQTDDDLKNDFILEKGRLADGSSPCKVPGLSLDNAAYNIVDRNEFKGNYGSGIKIVRSGFENIFSNNQIVDNNKGQNDVYHFFGVELGYAFQPDQEVIGLDFFPSYENQVLNNYIDGGHYAGIFLAEKDSKNTITGNTIMNSLHCAIEDISRSKNTIEDNTMN